MSEPVARQRPMIDLDEFERRLRRPAAVPQPNEDPLAELARLVGGEQDPFHGVFKEKASQDRGLQEKPAPQNRAVGIDRLARPADRPAGAERVIRAERPFDPPQVQKPVEGLQPRALTRDPARSNGLRASRGPDLGGPDLGGPSLGGPSLGGPSLGGNFAAIEAGLRGSIQPEYRSAPAQRRQQYQQPSYEQHYEQSYEQDYEEPVAEEDDEDWLEEAQMAMRPAPMMLEPPRSRRLLYVTAAIILIGIGGIGATFAIKRNPVSPQQIAMIEAATSPAKVQAPAPAMSAGAKAAIQDASVLDKTPQPPPVGVVNRVEQPVDLAQAAADAGEGSAAPGAASVPVPAPPGTTGPSGQVSAAPAWEGRPDGAEVADAAPGQAFGLAGMIQAKKVKTVTVRPDGTIVPDDAPPQMPPAAASVPQANPPQAEAPDDAEAATPKTVARLAADAGAPEREALVASPTGSEQTSRSEEKPKAKARTRPFKVVDRDNGQNDSAADYARGGAFAVQLAAPATEAEARNALASLTHKYGSELAGHHLKFRHAKLGSKSVYRVRVGGLSKPAAVKLCQSLEAKGGSCFVARD